MEMSDKMKNKLSQGREYRNMVLEVRAKEESTDEESYIVEGYATTFNQAYTLYQDEDMTLNEVVDRHAFDNCNMDDVIFQYNHEGRVFARTRNNTLQLQCDEHGLKVVADLGGTDEGRKLYQEIQGGYTDRMSFGFVVSADTMSNDSNSIYTRTITQISKLYDVSAVSLPANDMTEISARDYANGVLEVIKAERTKSQELELAKAKAKAKSKEWRY